MIRSGETLPDGGTTQADIAIVGAGAIGVALTVRLSERIGRIFLIEAGGSRSKPADNLSFFKAERVDDSRHGPTELYRRRMLGGTTSVWGGRCIPFDPDDFALDARSTRMANCIFRGQRLCPGCTRILRCWSARIFRGLCAARPYRSARPASE